MKRFCDLKVGDRLFIFSYSSKGLPFFSTPVKNIKKIKNALVLQTNWTDFVVNNVEDEFCISETDSIIITEAIATSMDKLLLELEQC